MINIGVGHGAGIPPPTLMLNRSTSMTIYLYKKTHNITGLLYLGKTTRSDPHKYKGSGIVWTRHIKKHGYDVTTEILKKCETLDDLRYWGLYYSELWDVVNATDGDGKKIWANLKPEEGQGWPSKIHNHRYDQIIYQWENIKTLEIVYLTQSDFIERYNLSQTHVSKLISGSTARCGDWHIHERPLNDNKGINNYQYDSRIFKWIHTITGEIVFMDRYQFAKHMNIRCSGNLSNVINGKRKTINKWKICES